MKKSIYRELNGYKYYMIKFKVGERSGEFLKMINDFKIEDRDNYKFANTKNNFRIVEVKTEDDKRFNEICSNYINKDKPKKVYNEPCEEPEEEEIEDNTYLINSKHHLKLINIDNFKLREKRKAKLIEFFTKNPDFKLGIVVSDDQEYYYTSYGVSINCLCGNTFKRYQTEIQMPCLGLRKKEKKIPTKKLTEFEQISNFLYCEKCDREYHVACNHFGETYYFDKGFLDRIDWQITHQARKEHTCNKCSKTIEKGTQYIRYYDNYHYSQSYKFCISCYQDVLKDFMNENNEYEYIEASKKMEVQEFYKRYKILTEEYIKRLSI